MKQRLDPYLILSSNHQVGFSRALVSELWSILWKHPGTPDWDHTAILSCIDTHQQESSNILKATGITLLTASVIFTALTWCTRWDFQSQTSSHIRCHSQLQGCRTFLTWYGIKNQWAGKRSSLSWTFKVSDDCGGFLINILQCSPSTQLFMVGKIVLRAEIFIAK